MANTLQTPSTVMSGYNNFNVFYALTRAQVEELLTYLNSATFLDNIQLLFETPVENVVSLRVYPFDIKEHHPAKSQPDSPIIINVVTTTVDGFSLNPVPSPPFNVGTVTIPRYYNSFLDYSPYTKLELYLPYIGFVSLDNSVVMGQTVSIDYVVDYFSGKCTAYLTVNQNIIAEYDGTIGIEVAIGGGRGTEIARNLLKFGIGATAGAISLGQSAIAMGAAKSGGTVVSQISAVGMSAGYLADTTINAIQAGQGHVAKGGASQPAINFYAPQSPYLIITRPNVVIPDTYAHDFGRPSGKSATLGDLSGFTVVDSVHVEGVPTATADEVTEIERLLKLGVIL